MMTLPQILSFLLTAVLITASPGPDNLLVLSMGISKGRLQGIAFGLGCAFGCLSHTLLAVLGVSALIAASPVAFSILKWVGGAYLIWLGVQAIRKAGRVNLPTNSGVPNESLQSLFFQGVVANAINPKVVLFFLSFLPQFVVADQGHVGMQLGALGLIFTVQAAVIFATLGFFAGTIGRWMVRTPSAGIWLDRIAGTIFVGLGVRMALR